MSALGHKRTCALQKVMSALAPKADMCSAKSNVRFGPIAEPRFPDDLRVRTVSAKTRQVLPGGRYSHRSVRLRGGYRP